MSPSTFRAPADNLASLARTRSISPSAVARAHEDGGAVATSVERSAMAMILAASSRMPGLLRGMAVCLDGSRRDSNRGDVVGYLFNRRLSRTNLATAQNIGRL